MRGLDLFCGAGCASRGYGKVGFEMVGVDHRPQRHYPYKFIQADVLDILHDRKFIKSFDFIHASPPCQFFSQTRHLRQNTDGKVDLLTPTLEWMWRYNEVFWIIENVERAPLEPSITLCGSMFGLTGNDPRRQLRRHRKFLTLGFDVPQPACQHNCFRPLGVYGTAADHIPGGGQTAHNLEEAKKLMGVDFPVSWRELREGVPPAYTSYVGKYLLEAA